MINVPEIQNQVRFFSVQREILAPSGPTRMNMEFGSFKIKNLTFRFHAAIFQNHYGYKCGGAGLKARVTAIIIFAVIVLTQFAPTCGAGAPAGAYGPPLDESLMAFKEQGVWYFLCIAPAYPYRIAPQYATYGPPPPPCGPVPCAPIMPPRKVNH